eukprot:4323815-Amphidinium_carterae.2
MAKLIANVVAMHSEVVADYLNSSGAESPGLGRPQFQDFWPDPKHAVSIENDASCSDGLLMRSEVDVRVAGGWNRYVFLCAYF